MMKEFHNQPITSGKREGAQALTIPLHGVATTPTTRRLETAEARPLPLHRDIKIDHARIALRGLRQAS